MRIKSFSYSSEDWVLQKIDLQEVNLIVGTNGTGKSKTLACLYSLIFSLNHGNLYISDEYAIWEISLVTNFNKILTYQLEIKRDEDILGNFVIVKESLHLEDKVLLKRQDDSSCVIFSENNQDFDTIHPPLNELALLSRRDTKAYPYIENIIEWAKNSYELPFSSINQDNLFIRTESTFEDYPKLYSKLIKKHQDNILENCNSIGFKISNITYESRGDYFFIKEEGLDTEIYIPDISQGMIRTICLLIYIEYLISKKKTATLLIDDLGEGLDYIRATELGKMLLKICKENNIQLIATSNDSFLMDVIDIDCWNVLQRKGNVVSSINIVNNPKLFEDFRYTGLSRFDFFSSDYIDSHL